jgi:hypothetical protein
VYVAIGKVDYGNRLVQALHSPPAAVRLPIPSQGDAPLVRE